MRFLSSNGFRNLTAELLDRYSIYDDRELSCVAVLKNYRGDIKSSDFIGKCREFCYISLFDHFLFLHCKFVTQTSLNLDF